VIRGPHRDLLGWIPGCAHSGPFITGSVVLLSLATQEVLYDCSAVSTKKGAYMIQKGPGDHATILDELDADERRGRQRGRRGVEARNDVPISTSKVPLRFFWFH